MSHSGALGQFWQGSSGAVVLPMQGCLYMTDLSSLKRPEQKCAYSQHCLWRCTGGCPGSGVGGHIQHEEIKESGKIKASNAD